MVQHTTGFNQKSNRGTATCDHCGKRTWIENIESGYCERCSTIFGYDNTIADNGVDSKDGQRAIGIIKDALTWKNYPVFPNSIFNSKITEQIVKEYSETSCLNDKHGYRWRNTWGLEDFSRAIGEYEDGPEPDKTRRL